jgi:hypothetical protein
MSKAAHTQGKWIVTKHITRLVISAGATPIAETPPLWTSADDPMQIQAEANARLIAAAPDLLAALQELDGMYVDAWDETTGALWFSPESVRKFERLHRKAGAAIEEATGAAP